MYDKEFISIIIQSNKFIDVCNGLNKIKDNKLRGTYFEWFAKLVLQYDSRYSNFVRECWLLEELPEKTREYLEIPVNDIGIDLIIKTYDDTYFAVQVKYRKNIDCVINWSKLSTFFGLTFGITNKFNKGIFFTNTTTTTKYIKGIQNIITILNHSLDSISENTFIEIKNNLKIVTDTKHLYTPREYQELIIARTLYYYTKNDKGRLYMPCGTGKTLVCYWIATKLLYNARLCVVVPSLYLLSQTYSVWVEMKKCNYLLIGSDAEIKMYSDTGLLLTTNCDDVKKYLDKYKNTDVVIISTYQSSDILSKACSDLNYELDMIIFDEAHRTVGTHNRQFSCLLNDDNIKTKKRLFTTATEKIYRGDSDDILSMDDTKIYGDVIYSYSFKQAIDDKQLCDYQIITPLITDKSFWHIVEKNKYIVNKSISDDPIESRYYMTAYILCQNIKEKGLTHILTFNNTNTNSKKIHKILLNMIKIMNIECNCYYLTGNSSMKERNKVITSFTKDKCAIISSARIFQEGVNIPIIDCVCFCDNKLSPIDIIQSIGRVLRICEEKKIGYILIPTLIDLKMSTENIFIVNPEDFGLVKNILKALGTIDDRIIDEFVTKNYGHQNGTSKFVLDTKNVELMSNIKVNIDELIGKIGTIICDKWGNVNWFWILNSVKNYIDENKKRPSQSNKNIQVRILGNWLVMQLHSYRKKIRNMKNIKMVTELEHFINEYSEYFKSPEQIWFDTLNHIKKFVDVNNKKPSCENKKETIKKMGCWIHHQQTKYNDKNGIMKHKNIYDSWTLFLNKYAKYFNKLTNWYDMLSYVKKFIDTNHHKPSSEDKNINIRKMGIWIIQQRSNYKKKLKNMKNKKIHDEWTRFTTEYSNYFKSNKEIWYDRLSMLKNYIDINKKTPSRSSDNINISYLGKWLNTQKNNYKKKIGLIKNKQIYDEWTVFVDKYSEYLI